MTEPDRDALTRLRDIARALEIKSEREASAPREGASASAPAADLAQVFEDVRRDVAARRAGFHESVGAMLEVPRLGFEALPPLHRFTPAEPLPYRDEYRLGELLAFDGEDFVRNAYRAVLRREPDASGMAHFVEELYGGRLAKVELLQLLSASQEGQRNPVRINGLARAARVRRWRRVPVIGTLITLVQQVIGLPLAARNLERHEIMVTRHDADLRYAVAALNHLAARTSATVDALGHLVNQLQREKASRAAAASLAERFAELRREVSDPARQADWRATQVLVARFAAQAAEIAGELSAQLAHLREENHAAVPALDDFYTGFEERFRGSREVIKDRVRVYVPTIREAGAGTPQAPVLDVGCGRGEWLEVLRDEGLVGRGIDMNPRMIEQGAQLGLEMSVGDALQALAAIPPGSLGAVTAMHLIEHLPFELQMALIDRTLAALRPGGVAIFETPNPENLTVGAFTFWNDPTHRRPVPPETLQAMAQLRGFARVEIVRLHPYPTESHLPQPGQPLRDVMNHLIYGPQDYAILAFKS